MAKKIGLLGALLVLAACAPSTQKRSTGSLDTVLRTAVEQRRVPGAVAMVASAGDVAYEGVFGFQKDTIFAIASMTKPVTSVAVMQLVEAGRVKLDDPVAVHLPDLAKTQVLEGGKLRAAKSPITVAAASDAHIRLQLRVHESRAAGICDARQGSQRHGGRRWISEGPAAVRSRHALGVRHQH